MAFQVYPYRWVILAIFSLLEIATVLLWVTFAPISDITQHYFGPPSYYSSLTGINMLANVFLIFYTPGTILGVILITYLRLKSAFIVAGAVTVAGSLLRYIATLTLAAGDLGHADTYWLMFLGQCLAAIAQPMFLNMPPAIALIWFPPAERDIATTIGAMVCPIGLAIGQIIPVILVSETESAEGYTVRGMADLMLVELIITVIPLVLTVLFFRDAPPTPPSYAASLKAQTGMPPIDDSSAKDDSFALLARSPTDFQALSRQVQVLLTDKHYLTLLAAFSVGVGFFFTILTLLNQLVQPLGYSNDDSGTFGSVFIVFGLLGAGVAGYAMERTRAYRLILKYGVLGCMLSTVFLLGMLYRDNFGAILAAFSLVGFFALPLLPVMMENCAECAYPISEDLSVGLLYVGGNLSAFGFIFATQGLLSTESSSPSSSNASAPWRWSSAFLLALIFISATFCVSYLGPYKRSQYEALRQAQRPDADADCESNGDAVATIPSSNHDEGIVDFSADPLT